MIVAHDVVVAFVVKLDLAFGAHVVDDLDSLLTLLGSFIHLHHLLLELLNALLRLVKLGVLFHLLNFGKLFHLELVLHLSICPPAFGTNLEKVSANAVGGFESIKCYK